MSSLKFSLSDVSSFLPENLSGLKKNIYSGLHIAKILPTSYFGYFGHVWPPPSKAIMPSSRNFDVYPRTKNELQIFLTSFLGYCKDNANLLL